MTLYQGGFYKKINMVGSHHWRKFFLLKNSHSLAISSVSNSVSSLNNTFLCDQNIIISVSQHIHVWMEAYFITVNRTESTVQVRRSRMVWYIDNHNREREREMTMRNGMAYIDNHNSARERTHLDKMYNSFIAFLYPNYHICGCKSNESYPLERDFFSISWTNVSAISVHDPLPLSKGIFQKQM